MKEHTLMVKLCKIPSSKAVHRKQFRRGGYSTGGYGGPSPEKKLRNLSEKQRILRPLSLLVNKNLEAEKNG